MPNCKNVSQHQVDLDDERVMQPGQTLNLDITNAKVIKLLATGELQQLDSVAAPAQPGVKPRDLWGAGSPAGVVAAPPGSTYKRTDGGALTTFYVKESGTGTAGWAAK